MYNTVHIFKMLCVCVHAGPFSPAMRYSISVIFPVKMRGSRIDPKPRAQATAKPEPNPTECQAKQNFQLTNIFNRTSRRSSSNILFCFDLLVLLFLVCSFLVCCSYSFWIIFFSSLLLHLYLPSSLLWKWLLLIVASETSVIAAVVAASFYNLPRHPLPFRIAFYLLHIQK